jgi:hypothetical protein
MKGMKLFRNQSGFSLVQGMMIAAAVAGASLVATRLLTDQKLAQRGAETRDMVEELHATVFTTLQDQENCTATIAEHSPVLSTAILQTSPVTVLAIRSKADTATATVVQAGTKYMANQVLVKSISFPAVATVGTERNIEIVYERLSAVQLQGKGYGAREIKKIIPVRLRRNPITSTFAGCSAYARAQGTTNSVASQDNVNLDMARQICDELNAGDGAGAQQELFVWDTTNNVCKPNPSPCPASTIFSGVDSTGVVLCRDIRDWVDFNQILDPTTTTCPAGASVRFEIDNVGKKVRIRCN